MAIEDEALAARVRNTLAQDKRLGGMPIMVRAANGDVFIKGRVDTDDQKELIALVCQGVAGVRRVVLDEIQIAEEKG